MPSSRVISANRVKRDEDQKDALCVQSGPNSNAAAGLGDPIGCARAVPLGLLACPRIPLRRVGGGPAPGCLPMERRTSIFPCRRTTAIMAKAGRAWWEQDHGIQSSPAGLDRLPRGELSIAREAVIGPRRAGRSITLATGRALGSLLATTIYHLARRPAPLRRSRENALEAGRLRFHGIS
jgi:hypothetical protein